MEIFRQKNVATRIVFPIVDADGDTVTAAAALDSESTTWADGSNPGAYADLTNEATEIGITGIYYLILTAAEVNFDYIAIQVKTTTTGAKTQHILINTLFAPKADSNGRVDVGSVGGTAQTAGDVIARLPAALVSGRMDASVGALATGVIVSGSFAAGAINAAAIATDAITAAKIAADAIGSSEFAQAAADKVFNSSGATLAELTQAIPAATPRPDQALMLLYMALRNRLEVTSSEKRISNDATTVIAKKALTDDGTTYREEEMVAGP